MIRIPKAAFPYILLQRTDYLVIPGRKHLIRIVCRLTGKSAIESAAMVESRLRRRSLRRRFDADMRTEYDRMRSWLPERPKAILDVGCGVGGIDIMLFDHYRRDPALHFYLLDRTQTDANVSYGFRPRADFYNSLELTRHMLVSNGLPAASLTMVEARDDNGIDLPERIDLVISLISWGFHYPVATYLERSHELLKPGGELILDVRKDTGGLQEIESTFGNAQVIFEAAKWQRVLAVRAAD
jgi:SAM-dependent methyltransferase